MDEYLSEQEQLERLTGWLRANVPWIVIGLAVGGLIVGGWRWWQARADRNGVEAAQSYSQILDAFDRGDRTPGLGPGRAAAAQPSRQPVRGPGGSGRGPAAAGDRPARPRRSPICRR